MKQNLRELYLEQLADIYSAETQLVDALPGMAWKARNQDLKEAFGDHLDETKDQVERLKKVFENHPSAKPDGSTCQAMKGLIQEGQEALDEDGEPEIIDAHLVAAAFRVEHYEIAAYKTAISMASALKLDDDVKLLKESLEEEEEASDDLEKMADGGMFSSGLHEAATKS